MERGEIVRGERERERERGSDGDKREEATSRSGSLTSASLVCAIFFTFPIQLFPAVEIAEASIFGPEISTSEEPLFSDLGLKRNAVRSLLVLSTGTVALLVPHFGEVIGL